MVFTHTINRPLFSASWTPATQPQYAGTCIFLIVLAFIFRFLLAWKAITETRWTLEDQRRNIIIVQPSAAPPGAPLSDEKRGIPNVAKKPGAPAGWGGRPWRWSTDLTRACATTVITGVGYLLMLAVMTMNVGYFMSVLAGVFVGELAWGRYITAFEH